MTAAASMGIAVRCGFQDSPVDAISGGGQKPKGAALTSTWRDYLNPRHWRFHACSVADDGGTLWMRARLS